MEMFIIYSLSGDYSGVNYHPAKKCAGEARVSQPRESKIREADAALLSRQLSVKCARMEEENRLLREELNELYVRYDRMSAAFGEMSHLAREAMAVPDRYFREDEA